ncbi:inositol monophosphatase [Hymenobacter busanensis]|uniref:Inositol-1-monophosphatase n=1 Tax=Hymenobacter busanensis TaxID=2607656 RepID=A0A7L4ZZI0_9BACT|nr:inositol monophosphatase family protein [Hymenobacter busanensis]KAA9333069.1 inositol monophosphatase [Hymenobacter busanensis]QHJ08256.1 inositol monophosphatase [Hymenobacter busanensis]
MTDFTQLSLQVAEVARRAGAFIRQEAAGFDRSRIQVKGVHDLVSYVDQESEKMVVAGLRELLPEAGFITEEGTAGAPNRAEEFTWIIDPLDGTTNFIHGLPCYSVSIALMQGSELVVGVVYEVNLDECFRAVRGGGAFCNEQPIRVSTATELNHSLIATGFPYSNFARIDTYLPILKEFMRRTNGVRRVGSAAVDLAWVAAGRFEGYFEFNINSYDVAAGILLVREAGGRVTQFRHEGDPVFGREVVASNGHVHDEMQAVIAEFWPA